MTEHRRHRQLASLRRFLEAKEQVAIRMENETGVGIENLGGFPLGGFHRRDTLTFVVNVPAGLRVLAGGYTGCAVFSRSEFGSTKEPYLWWLGSFEEPRLSV